MSQRMTMEEVLKEYGVPQLRLDVHATRTDLLKLREKLMAIRDLSDGREQGYLDIDCKLYIDVDDIDRYLSGELDTVGEIYAFPEDVKSYREQGILACSTRVCYGAPLVKVLICVFQFGYEYRGYPRIE